MQTQESLHYGAEPLLARIISPYRELGAYEALWARQDTTFPRLAKMFRERGGTLPSDFASDQEAEEFAVRALALLERAGVTHFGVRIHGAGDYPLKLRDARSPVELLYYRGCWDLVESRAIAVVGSRQVSPEGQARTEKLVRGLVEADFTIVSGLAAGVDTVAHRAALKAEGRTVAVLGTPLTHVYPKENADLQHLLASEFLVVSQVPVVRYSEQDYRENRYFFPERNKTMSALTEATVIVEAGETSGTLTQARAAFAQGRKLFILDSNFRNPKLTWPVKLESKGAIRVTSIDDILSRL
jgi:DNA processing protein